MRRKYVTIHYRRYVGGSSRPFTEPLASVFGRAARSSVNGQDIEEHVSLRRFEEEDGSSVVLNENRVLRNGDVFGELLRYDPNTNIPLVFQSQEPRRKLSIGEAAKPNGADFLRGMLFFMLRGDHVFLIEQDLTVGALERYARWLIFTLTRQSENDARIQLIPRTLLNKHSGLFERVQRITLSPPATIPNAIRTGSDSEIFTEEVSGANIRRILQAALLDTTILDRLAETEETAVKMTINLEFKQGRSKKTITGEDAVALLRHVPEEELIVKGDGAQNNRGSIERLKRRASVEHKGNILDDQSAFIALNDEAAYYRSKGLL